MRHHANPLSEANNFDRYENLHDKYKNINFVDIGCSFGYYIQNLQPLLPQYQYLGLEIRAGVVQEAQKNIKNIQIIKSNCMFDLPLLFSKKQLEIVTIMFPDPCFKQSQIQRRLVTTQFITELMYYMKNNSYFMICTDVKELFEYMLNEIDKVKMLKIIYDSDNTLQDIEKQQTPLKEMLQTVQTSPIGKLCAQQNKPWWIRIYQKSLH